LGQTTKNGFVVQEIIKKDEILEFVKLQILCACVRAPDEFLTEIRQTHRAGHSVIPAAREQLPSLDIVLIRRA
jgi:hypothetical protein